MAAATALLPAQDLPETPPDWRKIGGTSVDLMLASPATGPVAAVWYGAGGMRLYARTVSGRVFETLDFENWTLSASSPEPPAQPEAPEAERRPEPAAALYTFASAPGRIYAGGTQVYRSEDGGRSWANLTAYRNESVIGSGVRSLAVSPIDPDQMVVANDYGVWRSVDGGLSWCGANQFLPNLRATRILATPRGLAGARIFVPGLGVLELPPGQVTWQPAADDSLARQRRLMAEYSAALGAEVTAIAAAAETVYAGAVDGRIWISFDSGRNWRPSRNSSGGRVEKFFVDPAEPRVALAALSGPGPHILRTTNSGGFWDDLTANLADAPAHGVTADRAAGAIYAATDKGVFFARADLENAASPAVTWTPLTARLPGVAAMDVALDPGANQLYIALEGYGLYAAPAPHRALTLRLVNAADFSSRPAAPGSLISVVGGHVNSARAGALDFPVLAASADESQIQVPFEAAGDVELALETGRGPFRLPLPVQPVSPAIFVSRDGVPMLLDADTGLMLDAGNAARSGTRVQVLATGLGKVTPDWPTGLAAPLENPPAVAAGVRVWLDRVPLEVTRAVLAPGYVGFYLVEFRLPALVNAGPAELYISAGGRESNRVRILLEP